MIVKKCEHKNCSKAGTYKCPKDRFLKNYWHFCQEHAAEYNKNWNYYAGMTPEEINKEWEKDLFGTKDSNSPGFIFAHKKQTPKKTIPLSVKKALSVFNLTSKDNWDKIQNKYRAFAKSLHPDTAKSTDPSKFVKVSSAYQILKKFFNK